MKYDMKLANFKVSVWNWPLNICTYNGVQNEFPKDIYKKFTVLYHSICEYFNLKDGLQDLKFT